MILSGWKRSAICRAYRRMTRRGMSAPRYLRGGVFAGRIERRSCAFIEALIERGDGRRGSVALRPAITGERRGEADAGVGACVGRGDRDRGLLTAVEGACGGAVRAREAAQPTEADAAFTDAGAAIRAVGIGEAGAGAEPRDGGAIALEQGHFAAVGRDLAAGADLELLRCRRGAGADRLGQGRDGNDSEDSD